MFFRLRRPSLSGGGTNSIIFAMSETEHAMNGDVYGSFAGYDKRSMKTVALAAASLLLVGCSAKTVALGISPDKVDLIEIGTERVTVEDIVDSVAHEESCTSGDRVYYVYDRGRPPRDYPILSATFMALMSTLSVGMLEAITLCTELCQRGLLEVVYDSDNRVVAVYPRQNAYDVGSWCGAHGDDVPIGHPVSLSGKPSALCLHARGVASSTDRARVIEADDELIAATGCKR